MTVKACSNQEAIYAEMKHAKAYKCNKGSWHSKETENFTHKWKISPNQKIEKQLKFDSTKKQRLSQGSSLTLRLVQRKWEV